MKIVTPAPSAEGASDASGTGTAGAEPDNSRNSDLEVAHRIRDDHGEDLFYVPEWKQWLEWDGRRFAPTHGGPMRRAQAVAQVMLAEATEDHEQAVRAGGFESPGAKAANTRRRWAERHQDANKVQGALRHAQALSPIEAGKDTLDADMFSLNVENGTLDLATGQLRPHDRADRITKLAPVEYEPEASCPRWERFLVEIFDGDAELVAYMQRVVGYCLTGETSEHCFFFLYGRGANSKSTLIETLNAMLGDYARTTRSDTFAAKGFAKSGPTPALAALVGARFVSTTETADGRGLDEEFLKLVTGGDTVEAEAKYRDPFAFRPRFKIAMAGNYKPPISGTDEGIWRRLHLIPFAVQIPEAERDLALPAKLAAELPGILAWAVRGCIEWRDRGLDPPAAVLEAVKEYRSDEDRVGRYITEHCVVAAGFSVRGSEIYADYRTKAQAAGEEPMSGTKFGRTLSERPGITKRRSGGAKYFGIRLATDDD